MYKSCSELFHLINVLLTFSGHDTNPSIPKYRPLFLEHFDNKCNNAQSQLLKEPHVSHCKPNNVEPIEQPVQANSVNVKEDAISTKVFPTEDLLLIHNNLDGPIGYVRNIPNIPQAVDNLVDLHSNVMLQGPECDFVRHIKRIVL